MRISLNGARRGMLVAAATVLTLSFSGPANAASSSAWDTPPPNDKIVIDVVTVNGSGCRPGTAAVAVSPDNTAFTVTYSEYLAQAGRGSNPTDARKNCQLNILVHVPQGFTYAVAQADHRGFIHLERGARALQRANYYFQGQSQTAWVTHPFTGPMDDDWQKTDTTPVAALIFKPCGVERNLNINTELRVNASPSSPTSFITMDSTDGSIRTIYHFHWKRCP